jgi:hypothetical protein
MQVTTPGRNLIAIVLVSALVASSITLLRPTLANLLSEGPKGVWYGEVEGGRSVPTLSTDQRNQIATIAATDARLHSLLSSVLSPSQMEVVAWTDSAGNIIGGVATVKLPHPSTVSGEWLGLRWVGAQPDSPKPYTSSRYGATFKNVPSVRAFVDLSTGTVVGIAPDRPAELVGDLRAIDPLPT